MNVDANNGTHASETCNEIVFPENVVGHWLPLQDAQLWWYLSAPECNRSLNTVISSLLPLALAERRSRTHYVVGTASYPRGSWPGGDPPFPLPDSFCPLPTFLPVPLATRKFPIEHVLNQ